MDHGSQSRLPVMIRLLLVFQANPLHIYTRQPLHRRQKNEALNMSLANLFHLSLPRIGTGRR